jgi:membrane-bound lytic murein transglycosylase D
VSLGRVYLECAGLLTIGYATLWATRRVWLWSGGAGSSRAWLRAARAVLAAALLLPPATRALPDGLFALSVFPRGTVAGLWPAPRLAPAGERLPSSADDSRIAATPRAQGPALSSSVGLAVGMAMAIALAVASWRYRSLRRHLGGLPIVRRLGRVRLCACDATGIPYSARTWRRAFVVVPTESLADWPPLRLIVAHELQHHRQGDTLWVHGLAALRTAFPWLPTAYAWGRFLSELEEMACDEAVVRRRPGSAAGYARAILAAASGRRPLLLPSGTTAAASRGRLIRRRMEMILQRPSSSSRAPWRMGAASLALVFAAAFLARAEDSPVKTSPPQGGAAAAAAAEMAVASNDLVRAELDRFLSDPRRRAGLKAGLQRMEEHRGLIEGALDRHGLPRTLMVVPLIESAFENLEATSPRMASLAPGSRGAGLWMFIPETARVYGLRVDEAQDERLDVARATEAAAAYFSKLHRKFGDWPLALAAYNQGERAVAEAIRRGNTRDAFALQRQGLLNDYASTFMAAAIVVKDPSLLP